MVFLQSVYNINETEHKFAMLNVKISKFLILISLFHFISLTLRRNSTFFPRMDIKGSPFINELLKLYLSYILSTGVTFSYVVPIYLDIYMHTKLNLK